MSRLPDVDAIAQQTWLIFQLDGHSYAAPLSHVSEIIRDHAVTPVPGAANDLLGICQLRGSIVPVMDGRRRLGLRPSADIEQDNVRIVVFSHDGHRVGFRVDAVGDLVRPQAGAIEPPPVRGDVRREDDPVQAVYAWQGHFVALLDVLRLCRLSSGLSRVA